MACREYLIVMTECADAVFWRGRIAGLEDPPSVLDRVVLGRAVKFGVRAIGEKDGPPPISAAQLHFADAATQVAASPVSTERRESTFPALVSELPLRRLQE